MRRISLTEENLIELLKGNIVEENGVQMALKDIGYDRILNALIKHLKNA